ncbi:DUF3223 domain-containing protein [Cryobacterium adonitolivorans]|uniref:DUF3223 domain-containing protein n=1 Tax=Cryobacterium adonitolivorans TaxID=1259189 RepID=A0A4R8W4H6_9MICO|nr:DCL family protein [Cryobacterium adonitolivorans]TFC01486.1 DUF3223 domain-containing protein [Cryobacterium adonitolivorans]
MAIPFVIPSMSFRSRTAAKNYIRDNILRAYELRTRIPAGPHDQLLREVLRLHSDAEEKIGPGTDYFYVQETWRLPGREAVGRDQRAIIVVRSDATERDWSYWHVIDQPGKRPTSRVLSPLRLRTVGSGGGTLTSLPESRLCTAP